MAEKTFELIYSQQRTDFIEGRAYSNPRFFTSPRQGVTKVYLVGDWPKVEAAYKALGVPVEQLDPSMAVGAPEPPVLPKMLAHAEDPGSVDIPEDWGGLDWPDLRALAQKLTAEPVINAAQAAGVVAAEIARRNPEMTARDPLDHDGDGRKGGSLKGAKSTRAKGARRKKADT